MGYLVIEPKESCEFFQENFEFIGKFKDLYGPSSGLNLVRRFFISNGATEQRLKICQQTGYSIISDKQLVVSFFKFKRDKRFAVMV